LTSSFRSSSRRSPSPRGSIAATTALHFKYADTHSIHHLSISHCSFFQLYDDCGAIVVPQRDKGLRRRSWAQRDSFSVAEFQLVLADVSHV
jgi:hypothetical protein